MPLDLVTPAPHSPTDSFDHDEESESDWGSDSESESESESVSDVVRLGHPSDRLLSGEIPSRASSPSVGTVGTASNQILTLLRSASESFRESEVNLVLSDLVRHGRHTVIATPLYFRVYRRPTPTPPTRTAQIPGPNVVESGKIDTALIVDRRYGVDHHLGGREILADGLRTLKNWP